MAACSTVEPQRCGDGPKPAVDVRQTFQGQRQLEDIKMTFDRNRARIYAAYSKRLRANPCLEGRVVYRVAVHATGKVQQVDAAGSSLRDPVLEQELATIIAGFDFGPVADPGDRTLFTYPMDFVRQ
jgi:TonB family protein